jgi:hypothetical protein
VVTATVHLDFSLYDGEGGWASQDRWEQRLTLRSSFLVWVGSWCWAISEELVSALKDYEAFAILMGVVQCGVRWMTQIDKQ